MKVAAVGDIHVQVDAIGAYRDWFKQISHEADVLVLAGDITNTGEVSEAEVLAKELEACTIPVVCVLGNHDYDRGNQQAITEAVKRENIWVLEGDSVVIQGVGFAGVKGFGGGFGPLMLASFGEPGIKSFVNQAIQDALKLDTALAKLDTDYELNHKVVVTHYAPVRDTVIGEPEEIFPFLGSSHLAETIDRRQVAAAFHGHAHKGTIRGKTLNQVPVFNVCQAILAQQHPERPWFIWELREDTIGDHPLS